MLYLLVGGYLADEALPDLMIRVRLMQDVSVLIF